MARDADAMMRATTVGGIRPEAADAPAVIDFLRVKRVDEATTAEQAHARSQQWRRRQQQ